MYNQEQKQRYLNYCVENRFEETTTKLIEKIFNSTEMSESQFGKDVSEFNEAEVTDLLKSFNSRSRRRLQSNCIVLNNYYDWCYRIEKIMTSIINPYDSRIIDAIIDNVLPKEELTEKYYTKEEFIGEMLVKVADVSNQFIGYSLFMGITIEELVNITISDLDVEKDEIKLITGRTLKVDSLFKNLFIKTMNSKEYYPDGIVRDSRFNKYTYGESMYVLRICGVSKCEAVSRGNINTRLRVIKDQMENPFISAPNLYKNGLFSYIKAQYALKNISLKTAFFHEINKKLYTYDAETQQYISDFGSEISVRMLRMEAKDYIDEL